MDVRGVDTTDRFSERANDDARFRRSYPAFVIAALVLSACGGGAVGGSPPSTPGPSASPARSASPAPTLSSSPVASPTPASSAALPTIGTCTVFPADNPWNTDISQYPLNPNSANYLQEMNPSGTALLHPDFGSNATYGIPINIDDIEPANFTPITFTLYADQSDPGPYPIPTNPAIEAPTDSHMLIVDEVNCHLYETFATARSGGTWSAANGAIFDLGSDALRPEGWTSADAAGLPIAPGLVRYAEVQAGVISHALRFTMSTTFAGHIHPATHDAGGSVAWSPPMGLRLRLKASYSLASFHGESLVVLTALKKYGMMLADNGSNFYITGETNTNWDDNDLDQIKTVPASAFEVVQTGAVIEP
jgi:hypothetical protein